MGLTVHYNLKSTTKSETKARQLVEKMRQLALDLPFDDVSEIVDLEGDACRYDRDGSPDDPLRWLLIQCRESMRCPWHENISFDVQPTRVIAFNVRPGNGCEDANFGLCRYPVETTAEYNPQHDRRFYRDGHYSYWKFRKWADRKFPNQFVSESDITEQRTIRTRLSGWRWQSFCKTQYASDPACGGVANFLRCHVALVTLLERISDLQTVTAEIEDEGKFGPSTYSDDWREARAADRQPSYIWHPATHQVPTLLRELGDYNAMIAAFAGAMKDSCGDGFASPILSFQNFETLEFQGLKSEAIGQFLEAMATIAKSSSTARSAG